jgi:cytochrome o ubiquinol oxidase subunit II
LSKRAKLGLGLIALLIVAALVIISGLLSDAAILQPRGTIARQQRDLIVWTSALSLLVVVPVFAMLFGIAWKYREGNHKARYTPDWDHNRLAEAIWWGLPCLLILGLAIITWRTSHSLDPFKPLASQTKPITIQVVALQWKWLFIYPEQNIATINWVQFPEDTPINFEITADAPMNSFWIPQLGGQIYAMAGMTTKLHLMASEPGDYRGSSANLSGNGFASMNFNARASSQTAFREWVNRAKQSSERLDMPTYTKLAQPTDNPPVAYFSSRQSDIYDQIINKYMLPASGGTHEGHH